ncbi:hypothetical protein AAG906_025541 [Vitis piasezkii]
MTCLDILSEFNQRDTRRPIVFLPSEHIEDLKKEVKRELTAVAVANPSQLLNFIDAVQRLGVAYHFKQEIEEALQHICNSFHDCNDMDGDLYNIALGFRLLRQQGFKEALISNVRGMLGLYEAAHLRVNGEDILAEALTFTTTHLKAMVESLGYPLAEQVAHTLNRPIRKGLERLEARCHLHKEELSNLARLVECYFCILGVYFEPQCLRAKAILTKVIAMTFILDDIYDAYGTPDELKLFIELPEYMKPCYVALFDVYKEIEEEMEKEGNQYTVHYAKEVVGHL